jgi:outer membrane protein insertion porin family
LLVDPPRASRTDARPTALGVARALRLVLWLVTAGALLALPPTRAAQAEPRTGTVAILPFTVNSAKPLEHLQRSLPELLASRLEAGGRLHVVDPAVARDAATRLGVTADEAAVRKLAADLGADTVITASLTELAGRFSLDVRVTAREGGTASRSYVYTAESEEELLDRVNELADQLSSQLSGRAGGAVTAVRVEGVPAPPADVMAKLRTRVGQPFDASAAREDLALLREQPGIGTGTVETEPDGAGVRVTFRMTRAGELTRAGGAPPSGAAARATGERIAAVEVRGNRRIEAAAILARVSSKAGEPYEPARVSQDVRAVFGLGFFRDVRVLTEPGAGGPTLIFEVEENPIVRQVAISGNDSIDSEKIRDAMTLTTGSTLDYPLVYENTQRIEQLYRSEGYYLAKVRQEIQPLGQDAVAVNFQVEEGKKLRLEEIRFEGNEALSTSKLEQGMKTKPWHWYSYVSHFIDNSGTYSEPVFLQDMRGVEQKYTDDGYLQVELSEPRVEAKEEGLVVVVDVTEGPQFKVGSIDVTGDESADVERLREKLLLKPGDVFNRSHLTTDVEGLTSHYTDRGFYFANVNPRTNLKESDKTVDVDFQVERGDLHFVKEIEISGNTTTIDPVIRRELRLVEGQLWSARAVDTSKKRLESLGFFEEVNFEPKPTDQPGLLDLGVKVVEKPTGSLSFGAGFSSQDGFILSGSVSQSNLFGRGYGVQLSADIGGQTNRFFLSFSDSYFLDTEFGLGATAFLTKLDYQDFTEKSKGVDLNLGHALNEENTARGYVSYGFTKREVDQSSNVNAASLIFREVLQGQETTSLLGVSVRGQDLDNFLAPKDGYQYAGAIEGAGLGGFSKFARFEGRTAWYFPAPRWVPLESTFMLAARGGWAIPFNQIGDYDLPKVSNWVPEPDPSIPFASLFPDAPPLDRIDKNLELPLTERYFLGGLGTFQLRGYKARSVGPRRAVLRRSGLFGGGPLFAPVGTSIVTVPGNQPNTVSSYYFCDDTPNSGNQGNENGKCNSLKDKNNKDFNDLKETDVIGGNKYVSLSAEYRFPISETLGLMGILFLDAGGALAEDQSLFQVSEWRYGTGFGALWFSPFGPLQGFLGFPINPLSVEQNFVFEFSVGGANF